MPQGQEPPLSPCGTNPAIVSYRALKNIPRSLSYLSPFYSPHSLSLSLFVGLAPDGFNTKAHFSNVKGAFLVPILKVLIFLNTT